MTLHYTNMQPELKAHELSAEWTISGKVSLAGCVWRPNEAVPGILSWQTSCSACGHLLHLRGFSGKPCGQLPAPAPGHCPAPGMSITSLFIHTGVRGEFWFIQGKSLTHRMHNRRDPLCNPLPLSRSKSISSKTHRNTSLKISLINSPKPWRK